MDTVIGIDLSGRSGRTPSRTAAAQLVLSDRLAVGDRIIVRLGQEGDRQLVEWIQSRRPRAVAIDAPLSLPHSLGCTRDVCERCEPGSAEYLTRDVDRMAKGMSTSRIASIAFRGLYLARVLRAQGAIVIETYPGAAYRGLGVDNLDAGGRAHALAARVGRFDWSLADEVDAVAAALAAADYVEGSAEIIVGEDGTIVLPRR